MKKIVFILFLCTLLCFSAFAKESDVLSQSDVKTYKQIFAAQKKGEFKTAGALQNKLKNKALMGYVLFDRYFSPHYKTKPEQITEWFYSYHDLPIASDMYALGKQKKAQLPKSKPKDVFSGRAGSCSFVMREEPIDLVRGRLFSRYTGEKQQKARKTMNQFARHLSAGRTKNARLILEGKDARELFNNEEMGNAYTALAFSYFLDGEDQLALTNIKKALQLGRKKIPLAYWTAGLISWRMGDIVGATKNFETLVDIKGTYPLLRSSGAFWAARGHLRQGNFEQVGDYLEIASDYPRTFYGFLAMRLLGQDLSDMWETPMLPQDDVSINFSHPGLERFYALKQIGKMDWAKKELAKLYVEADKDGKGVLFMISDKNGFSEEILAVSGHITGDEDLRYPAPNWTPKDGWKVDKALVFSFVKQESCFNQRAESRVGALGLMQIMPATGKELAGRLNYTWNPRTMKEPAYNLSLGQNYLLELLGNTEVNNNLIFTAVAYNAGPGNLARWKKRMKYQNDPLMFIETIPSKETRSFVERIMVNYWVYRVLMGQPVGSLDDVTAGKWPIYKNMDKK